MINKEGVMSFARRWGAEIRKDLKDIMTFDLDVLE